MVAKAIALAALTTLGGCVAGTPPSAIDGAETDAPDVDAPDVDAPVVDAPLVDAPHVDAAALDATQTDAATLDAPQTDAPHIDAAADAAWMPTGFDLNGDGVADLVVTDTAYDGAGDWPQGGFYRLDGRSGAGGGYQVPYQGGFREYGRGCAMVDDLDGDNVADVVIGDLYDATLQTSYGGYYVYSGVDGQLIDHVFNPAMYSHIGAPIVPLGDIDGDGRGDFAIGRTTASGADFLVYSGATRTLRYTGTGYLIAGVGDVDGDGVRDLASYDAATTRIHVTAGDDQTLFLDVPGNQAGPIGDVDHDGHDDVVVALDDTVSTVTIYKVVPGNPAGVPLRSFTLTNDGAYAIARLGDVDGDGTPDLLAKQLNAAVIYSGATGAVLRSVPDTGSKLAATGDLDGDGHPDFVVGCEGCRSLTAPTWSGQVTAYSGATGAPLWQRRGALYQTGQYLGACVAGRY